MRQREEEEARLDIEDFKKLVAHTVIETAIEKAAQIIVEKDLKKHKLLYTLDEYTSPYHERIPFKEDEEFRDFDKDYAPKVLTL